MSHGVARKSIAVLRQYQSVLSAVQDRLASPKERLCRWSKSVAAVAHQLGVNSESLRKWRLEARAAVQAAESGGDGPMTGAEREELRRLRKQVRELELEKEILRKAAAYFAQEMGR